MPRAEKDYHSFEREIDSWRMRKKDSSWRKSYDEVFDRQNLMRLYKLFTDGTIEQLDFPLKTGKEGNVFRATTAKGELVAVKIYRTSTATFKDMAKYVQGDPRFKGISSNRRKLVLAWASKEFRNLQRLYEAGVRVPKPITHHQNIIVMEYIGTADEPAREMRQVPLEDPEAVMRKILGYMKLAYQKAGLVHGDMSEFNVLMLGQDPVIIDVGQGVMLEHPLAQELLERDVGNVARYFKKYGLQLEVAKEIAEIKTP